MQKVRERCSLWSYKIKLKEIINQREGFPAPRKVCRTSKRIYEKGIIDTDGKFINSEK